MTSWYFTNVKPASAQGVRGVISCLASRVVRIAILPADAPMDVTPVLRTAN